MQYIKLDIQKFADGKVVIDTDLNNDGFSKGLDKMKSIASKGFKAVASTAGVVATGLTAAITAGVKSYADLEQNVGGVETLFKDSADKVIKNAERAYQTAGVSANKYMEQVTSFSASLLQSLGGDTEAAATYADRAIVDMSDNANKMGTSIEMIQNAYQGFAKQNFTMLDNLKLGYGGTKTEMERLIADANKVKEANGEMADLSIDSFADITEAIHIIQDEMGITGTTFEEAEDTISGSLNSAKAALDNFLNGSGDIETFVETLTTALGNIGGAIVELAPSIMEGIGSLIEQLIPQIPVALNSLLPVLIESTVNIINSLAQALPAFLTMIQENSQIFIDGAMTIITTLVTTLIQNLPQLLQTGIQLIVGLAQGLTEQLPTLIPLMIQAILDMVDTLLDNIDLLIDAGIQLIMGLAEGLINALPDLIDKIPEIIDKLITAITDNLPKLIEAGITLTIKLAEGLIKAIPQLIAKLPQIITSIISGLLNGAGKLVSLGGELLGKIKTGITNGISGMLNIGKNIVQGLWNGINNAKDWVLGKIKGFGKSILNGLKSFFGIKSPSRVMRDQIGKYLAEGVGVGFEDAIDDVYKDMQKAVDIETEKMSANVQTSGVYQIAMNGTPTFNLLDNTNNRTQLVVDGKILADVVNTENRHREVAKA